MRTRYVYRLAMIVLTAVTMVGLGPIALNASEMATDLTVPVVMPAGAEYVVMDVLDGVEARYRTMNYNDVYGAYSCAGYVKAYYDAVYGVNVQNLTDTGPLYPEDLFMQVETPQKGDIIFYPSPPSKNNHSAIVKAFDGQRIVLIEQDYKWAQAGGTYTYLNRTIPYPPDTSNPYQIWRLVFIQDEQLSDSQVVMPGPDPPTVTAIPDQPAENMEETTPVFVNHPTLLYESVVTIGRYAITVNGTDMPIDAPALIENNRTVMPVRWVGYALGLTDDNLIWNESSRTVVVFHDGGVVQFTIDSNILLINNIPVMMDCPASLKGGRAYLPVRFLADALGVNFEWDPVTASVTFYKMDT